MNANHKDKRTKEQILKLLDNAIEQEERLSEKIKLLESDLADCRKKAENPRAELTEEALSSSKVSFRLDYYRTAKFGPLKGIIEHLPSRETKAFEGDGLESIGQFIARFLNEETSISKKKKVKENKKININPAGGELIEAFPPETILAKMPTNEAFVEAAEEAPAPEQEALKQEIAPSATISILSIEMEVDTTFEGEIASMEPENIFTFESSPAEDNMPAPEIADTTSSPAAEQQQSTRMINADPAPEPFRKQVSPLLERLKSRVSEEISIDSASETRSELTSERRNPGGSERARRILEKIRFEDVDYRPASIHLEQAQTLETTHARPSLVERLRAKYQQNN